MMQRKRLMPTGQCWCGCGEETGRGSFFRQGHDKSAESKLIVMLHGNDDSVAHFLDDHGYGPLGKNLTDTFEEWKQGDDSQ